MDEQCLQCGHTFDIHNLKNGLCSTCESNDPVCDNIWCKDGKVYINGEQNLCHVCRDK
jgi:hypothetical protein